MGHDWICITVYDYRYNVPQTDSKVLPKLDK